MDGRASDSASVIVNLPVIGIVLYNATSGGVYESIQRIDVG